MEHFNHGAICRYLNKRLYNTREDRLVPINRFKD
jgi:hypothetical protein